MSEETELTVPGFLVISRAEIPESLAIESTGFSVLLLSSKADFTKVETEAQTQ